MLKTNVKITIGSLEIPFAVEGSITSSWKELTDTAQLTIPRNIVVLHEFKKKPLSDVVKVGNEIKIEFGYDGDGDLQTEFEGFVSNVTTGVPIKIECEDKMWLLKQSSNIEKSWRKATLKDVIAEVAEGFETEVADIALGAFRISGVNAAQVLARLKKNYGIKSYFRNGVLHVGFAYPLNKYKKVKYHFQKNIVDRQTTLQYRTKEEIKIQLKAISILPDNTKVEVKLGDSDGAIRTLHYFDLNQQELEEIANREIEELKFDGYRGKFTGFGIPRTEHGDIVELEDGIIVDQNGSYFVDKVVKRFGFNVGLKRDVTLGKKASNTQITEANE